MTRDLEGASHLGSQEEISAERSRLLQRGIAGLTVAAAGVSLAFQQSPANEAMRVNIGLDVLQNTQSSVAVGATIFGVTTAVEMGSSTLIALGLNSEIGAVQKFKDRLNKKNQAKLNQAERKSGSKNTVFRRMADKASNAAIALGVGAGLVAMKKHMRDPEPSLKKDLKNSAKATGVVAGVSGGIGYLASGGIKHASGTIIETPAELFVDYGTDTKFWIGALAVGYGAAYAKKGIQSLVGRSNNNEENIQAIIQSNEYGQAQADDSVFTVYPRAEEA